MAPIPGEAISSCRYRKLRAPDFALPGLNSANWGILHFRTPMKVQKHNMSESPFVVAIGGANIDIHGIPATALRLRDSNPGTVQLSPGGVARNIAENLVRLGVDCRLISAVAGDLLGDLILQQGADAGIDMQHVEHLPQDRTSTYLSVLDESGDMYVGISDVEIADALTPDTLADRQSIMHQAEVIVLDANLSGEAIAWIAGTFAEKVLFADPVSTAKCERLVPHLRSIHTLKPSLIEAVAMAGVEVVEDEQLPALASWFHDRGVQRLFVTMGERGVYYSTPDAQGIETMKPARIPLCNAGGAGDAFLAALVCAWLHRWTLEKSVRFGLAAASITLSHAGTGSPALTLAAIDDAFGTNYDS